MARGLPRTTEGSFSCGSFSWYCILPPGVNRDAWPHFSYRASLCAFHKILFFACKCYNLIPSGIMKKVPALFISSLFGFAYFFRSWKFVRGLLHLLDKLVQASGESWVDVSTVLLNEMKHKAAKRIRMFVFTHIAHLWNDSFREQCLFESICCLFFSTSLHNLKSQ